MSQRSAPTARWLARVTIPSLVAGVLLALSLPPFGWWPLAFFGCALLFWRLRGLPPRTRMLSGWCAGIGCYGIGLAFSTAFNWYGSLALISAEACFMGVGAVLVPRARRRILMYAAAFALLEALRSTWPFGGLSMGGVFLGQANGPFLDTARIGGPLLVTAVIFLGGAGIATLCSVRGQIRSAVLAILAVVALAVIAVGAPNGGSSVGRLRVAAIQGGGVRGLSALQVTSSTVFDAQLAATRDMERADHAGAPRLVVWPEDVIRLTGPLRGTPQAEQMAALARQLHATVLAGVTEIVSTRAFRNEAVAWGPNGRVVGTYEKVHRVPFGEYVPWRGFFSHLANLEEVPRDAIPGHGTGLVRTPAGPIGVLISYEVFFADRGTSAVRAGAELLVIPTNTSSYSSTQVPAQEVAADRILAVEEGRDVIQAAPAGYSTVVDRNGRVQERTALDRRQALTAIVTLRKGHTLYNRWGDLPVLVFAGAILIVGWYRSERFSRRPRAQERRSTAQP